MQWTSGVPFVSSPPTEKRLPQLPDQQHSYDSRSVQCRSVLLNSFTLEYFVQ